jgi:hypothetical protein
MMDFIGPAGNFSVNNFAWGHLLDLATRYGWQPAGLLPPEPDPDDDPEDDEAADAADPEEDFEPGEPTLDDYFWNDGFRVTDEDARALADALERSLPDVPDHDALGHKTTTHPGLPGQRLIPIDAEVSPFEYFSGPKGKGRVKEFIAFCRQGGFAIW